MGRSVGRWSVLVTAEHGGYQVPGAYRALFRGSERLLRSHRGWDPGTLDLARRLAARAGAPLMASTVTRLLVDLNRSAHNPRVFSEITRSLPPDERIELLEAYHGPHRDGVRREVERRVQQGQRVLHLGVHSFTPEWKGVTRVPDLSLLYDPRRESERALAAAWVGAMARADANRAIRRNDPYRGNADGLTTTLRTHFPDHVYMGIEIEVNQRHLGVGGTFPAWVEGLLTDGLGAAEGSLAPAAP